MGELYPRSPVANTQAAGYGDVSQSEAIQEDYNAAYLRGKKVPDSRENGAEADLQCPAENGHTAYQWPSAGPAKRDEQGQVDWISVHRGQMTRS